MSTLIDFLLARIAEDETVARDALHPDAVSPGEWITEHHNSEYHSEPNRAHIAEDKSGHYWSVAHEVFTPIAEHMARHDPARVLAECKAKRRIVNSLLDRTEARSTEDQAWALERGDRVEQVAVSTLRLLALAYADHPDYDETWRP